MLSILNFRKSSQYIFTFLLFLYSFLSELYKLSSFSINIKFFGFLFKISLVKEPFPGPISKILLFSIWERLIIF